jgi:diaminobutyrate-2-oxoglutarate transaminase
MQGIDMGDSARAASIRQRCVERGLLIECSGSWDEVVKVMAPLTTPDDLLEAGLTILAGAVADEYRQLV